MNDIVTEKSGLPGCWLQAGTCFRHRREFAECQKEAQARQSAARLRRNAQARARSQAMRDLGLTRTRSGSWE
jgi:hypothetical protein